MKNKTYKTIAASQKTLRVLEIIAPSIDPVVPLRIAAELDLDYNTVMCHIATLEQAGWIERMGDGYSSTLKLGTFWAAKKAQLESTINKAHRELKEIGA